MESPEVSIQVRHTAELDVGTVRRIRTLLDLAFAGDFGDADFEHALGGVHLLAWDGEALVGHAALVQRRLLYQGRALRTAYVEAVAVHPRRQRAGIGGRLMAECERIVRAAYDLGAASATDASVRLYAGRGWRLWEGRTAALTPAGLVPTPEDDGNVFVFSASVRLDAHETLACDFRDGDLW